MNMNNKQNMLTVHFKTKTVTYPCEKQTYKQFVEKDWLKSTDLTSFSFSSDSENVYMGYVTLFFKQFVIKVLESDFALILENTIYARLKQRIEDGDIPCSLNGKAIETYPKIHLSTGINYNAEPLSAKFGSLSMIHSAVFYKQEHLGCIMFKLKSFQPSSGFSYMLYKKNRLHQLTSIFLYELAFRYSYSHEEQNSVFSIFVSRLDNIAPMPTAYRIFSKTKSNTYETQNTKATVLTNNKNAKLIITMEDIYEYKYCNDVKCFIPDYDSVVTANGNAITLSNLPLQQKQNISTCCNKQIENCKCFSNLNHSSFTPFAFKHLPQDKYIGFELEFDFADTNKEKLFKEDNNIHESAREYAASGMWIEQLDMQSTSKQWYFKTEESVSTGFEIVSMPFTPNHLQDFEPLFQQLQDKQIHDATTSLHITGTHFHFDKSWWKSKRHVVRTCKLLHELFTPNYRTTLHLQTILNTEKTPLLAISGRKSKTELRKYSAPTKYLPQQSRKDSALADRGATYEFRFFASTKNYTRLQNMIAFLTTIIEITKEPQPFTSYVDNVKLQQTMLALI